MTTRRPPISINFAAVNYRLAELLRTALWALGAVLSVTAVLLLLQTRSLRAEAAAIDADLQKLSVSLQDLRPAMEERQRIVGNLNAMSAFVGARAFSWTGMLTSVEEAFPAGLVLDRLAFGSGTVELEGDAQSPEALSGLMIGLQKSRAFRNPQLKRQSLDKGSLKFHVAVVYQDIPAGGPSR